MQRFVQMKSLSEKYWELTPNEVTAKNVKRADELRVAPEIITLLQRRGVAEEDIAKYLYPSLSDLPNPFLMKNMEMACTIVIDALNEKRRILIWGDYDVDGVTSTALLIRFFALLNIQVTWNIPHRLRDGYGLSRESLEKFLDIHFSNEKKQPLIITVDCGISDYEAIDLASKRGCKVIVTDHHEPGELRGNANAVLNVKQHDCTFPDKKIAGVGTAFFFVIALRSAFKRNELISEKITKFPMLKPLLELVAIGTIADMACLTGINRVLVKGGFEVLSTKPSVGVHQLLVSSDIKPGLITSEDIAFQIGPKLNAAGRIDDASLAVQLLIEEDPQVAKKLAKKLTILNTTRKELCAEYLEITSTFIDRESDEQSKIIVQEIDCSLGIIGIVCSQLVTRLKKPVILVTQSKTSSGRNVLKGSCRSVQGVNIHDLLKHCKKYLIEYGGHRMAAGLTIDKNVLSNFAMIANEYLLKQGERPQQIEKIDLSLPIEKSLSPEIIDGFLKMEPFGIGNRRPVFIDKNVIIQEIKQLGATGDHLSLVKRSKYENIRCIAFNLGGARANIQSRSTIDIVYSLTVSRYKNNIQWKPNIVDCI